MKTTLVAFLLLASLVSGFSQTQERKLIDRIMKPDLELGNPLQNRSFSKTSEVLLKSSPKAGLGFYGTKSATGKSFPFTRSFLGLKNPWFGGKVFATKEMAGLSKHDLKRAGTEFGKSAEVSDYEAASKPANFGSPVVPTSAFVPRPAAGGAVSKITDKINNKMTIDEVRELLNKPR